MKKSWLTLSSDSFLWIKKEKGLIYNVSNFDCLRFSNSTKINSICKKLLNPDNLYSTIINENEINDNNVIRWINAIVSRNMGVFTPNIINEEHPISFKPILKIQDGVNHYIWEKKKGVQGSILNNLHEITFYYNGSKNGSKKLYRQALYPIKTEEKLDMRDIIVFCHNSINPFFTKINLVGELFGYVEFEKLLNDLTKLNILLVINITYEDFLYSEKNYMDLIKEKNVSINVFISNLGNINNGFYYHNNLLYYFLVTSLKDYKDVYEMFDKCKTEANYQLMPIFEYNADFFRFFLFVNEEEFDSINLTKREIFIRQSLNLNDFGKLTVLPNGNVYSNVNRTHLGKITDLPINLVYEEFTKGRSWLCVRNKKPCNKCIYQWLCPPLSNYEILMRRNNLCNIVE